MLTKQDYLRVLENPEFETYGGLREEAEVALEVYAMEEGGKNLEELAIADGWDAQCDSSAAEWIMESRLAEQRAAADRAYYARQKSRNEQLMADFSRALASRDLGKARYVILKLREIQSWADADACERILKGFR